MPTCWIIAGPNGAGKTTFALDFLPSVGCMHFINADSIAAGLNPIHPESETYNASRIYLNEIRSAIKAEKDFAFETTLSGRSYLSLIKDLKAKGWRIELIYLALPSVEMSHERVRERVLAGGHNIPAAAIDRRFPKSLQNLFESFSKLADHTICFINHKDQLRCVFEDQNGDRQIFDQAYTSLLKESSQS